jgi:hypothetical protein
VREYAKMWLTVNWTGLGIRFTCGLRSRRETALRRPATLSDEVGVLVRYARRGETGIRSMRSDELTNRRYACGGTANRRFLLEGHCMTLWVARILYRRTEASWINDGLERILKETVVAELRYYRSICLVELRKRMVRLSGVPAEIRMSNSLTQVSSVTARLICSVKVIVFFTDIVIVSSTSDVEYTLFQFRLKRKEKKKQF